MIDRHKVVWQIRRGATGIARDQLPEGMTEMKRLRIVPLDENTDLPACRGRLFEELVDDVLRRLGYKITAKPNVDYGGMEIDVEGIHEVVDAPFIGECKCYASPLDGPELQRFLGKYYVRCGENARSQGVLFVIPRINSPARGLWRRVKESRPEANLALIEEENVIELLERADIVCPEAAVRAKVEECEGVTAGDILLVKTERGYLWVILLIGKEALTPSLALVTNAKGMVIGDGPLLTALRQRLPELDGLEIVKDPASPRAAVLHEVLDQVHEVVSVTGSSGWFDYQFPASPAFFVGRDQAVDAVRQFVAAVHRKTTASRVLLVQANSGWGKSSLALAMGDALRERGCYVSVIDCRAASTPQFALRSLSHLLVSAAEARVIPEDRAALRIPGMASVPQVLREVDKALLAKGFSLCLFLDQFEGLFGRPEILAEVAGLVSVVHELQGRVFLGFAWKTDLIGTVGDFPYRTRERLTHGATEITLGLFGEKETTLVLDALRRELGRGLRKDLEFLLTELSQGYPWLLKKLCAHVIEQIAKGVKQIDLAAQMLRVQNLFEDDLKGLNSEEEAAIRHIARLRRSVTPDELADQIPQEVLRALVNRRLVVRVGPKYSIYWDIFADYLNTGNMPVQESYLLRMSPGGMIRIANKLRAEGPSRIEDLLAKWRYVRHSFHNVLRELRLLGLVDIDGENVLPKLVTENEQQFEESLRQHLEAKLQRHRFVKAVLDQLANERGPIDLNSMASALRQMYGYVSADERTWRAYARNLAKWLRIAGLAEYDRRAQRILRFDPSSEVRDLRRALLPTRRARGHFVPEVQYARIEAAMLDMRDAMSSRSRTVNLQRISRNAWPKALAAAEALGFLELGDGIIRLTAEGARFLVVSDAERRRTFARMAPRIRAFAEFVEIMRDPASKGCLLAELGAALAARLGTQWTHNTATWVAKILNNWAKAAHVIPDTRRKPRRAAASA